MPHPMLSSDGVGGVGEVVGDGGGSSSSLGVNSSSSAQSSSGGSSVISFCALNAR